MLVNVKCCSMIFPSVGTLANADHRSRAIDQDFTRHLVPGHDPGHWLPVL